MNRRPFRIAVLASGTGTNLDALLDRFPAGGATGVVLVVSDRPGARALERARAARVPAEVVEARGSGWARELLRLLASYDTDLVVLAGFLRKVPAEVVAAFRGRIVNVHPAPLPAFGGPGMYGSRVHAAVLASGAAESAATVHFVDEEYDRGPVIASRAVPVLPGDTPETLARRVLAVEHQLLPDVVEAIAGGRVRLAEEEQVEETHRLVGNVRVRRALLSVSDKTGLVELGRGLAARGVELVSTGGTAAALRGAGLTVRDVAEVTGFPEILDGRVKTLHPAIFAGLLARQGHAEDAGALERLGIARFQLVAVNLYPFAAAAREARQLPDDALEQIDIGGPSLLRAAAKNHGAVAVVCDPSHYAELLGELEARDGSVGADLRRRLAGEAFAHTAGYDAAIAAAFGAGRPETLPARLAIGGTRALALRYGENPHQEAAFYADPPQPRGLAAAPVLQGKALSFNNLLDLDAAWRLAEEVHRVREAERDLPPAACVIIKHATPCGVGVGESAVDAYERARATDPVSAFGGVCVLTVPLTPELVEAAAGHFLEVLAGPSVDRQAREALASRKGLRVLELPGEPDIAWDVKRVAGGLLVQQADRRPPLAWSGVRVVTGALADELRPALALAWATVKHVRSNAIVLGDGRGTVGIGAGQMSRVDAVELAVRKARAAGHDTTGSVLASDAFFPFRDGLDVAAAAGVAAVIQPGGSVRDAEVIAAAREHGIVLVHTGTRHFRH